MDHSTVDVVFRIPRAEEARLLQDLAGLADAPPVRLDGGAAVGGGDLVAVAISVGLPAFAVIAKQIVEYAKLKRTTIEIDGVKASSISTEAAEAMLKRALERKHGKRR